METIFQKTMEAVAEGAKFSIDFKKRRLAVAGKEIIVDGICQGSLGIELDTEDQFKQKVQELYEKYAHSTPSERSEGHSRLYFRALPEHKLTTDDMLYGAPRELARCHLEFYVLCQIILGFHWNPETMGTWFWQGDKEQDCIVLRDWFENSSINK